MFKKIIAVVLALVMAVGVFCMLGCGGSNEDDTNSELTVEQQISQSEFLYPDKTEDFRYNRYTYYVKITQCLSLKSNIVIPETIAGLPVYEIQENAFKDQLTVNSISIADSVITIGEYAFSGCTNLEEIKLPKSVTAIGENAFSNTGLRHIEFPNTLSIIPASVCSGCENLSYVIIDEPAPIVTEEEKNSKDNAETDTVSRTIENSAFSGCPSLKFMWVPEDVVFTDETMGDVDDHFIMYGYSKSSAAAVAAASFVDFKLVQSKAELTEFKNKAELASDTVTLTSSENYKGSLINMQIEKTYVVREKINYETYYITENNETAVNTFEFTPEKGTNLVVFGVKVTNNSSQKINFNQLNSTIKVDTYFNRFVNLGTIKNSALAKYCTPSYTIIEPDTTSYLYFAAIVDDGWEEIVINFGNFSELLNYNFVVNNDESVIYVGTESTGTEDIPPEETIVFDDEDVITEENTENNEESTTEEQSQEEKTSEVSQPTVYIDKLVIEATTSPSTTETETTQG